MGEGSFIDMKIADPAFLAEYDSHISTWAAHCGAPKGVYIGHIEKLLQAAIKAEREACARIADSEAKSRAFQSGRDAAECIGRGIRGRA